MAQILGREIIFTQPLYNGDYTGSAVLILQCAGTVVSQGAVAEANQEGPQIHLPGCDRNVEMMKNFYKERGVQPGQIETLDFTGPAGGRKPKDVIFDFLKRSNGMRRHIYYTGHGCQDGRLAFHLVDTKEDDYLSHEDMADLLRRSGAGGRLTVNLQCCYSGTWCQASDFVVHSSAAHDQVSFTSSAGSYVTQYWCRKRWRNVGRLGSQPMKNWGT